MIGDLMILLSTLYVVVSVVAMPLRDNAIVERVDLIEVNHLHDQQGNPTFDQIIFWKWHQDESAYHVRDWTMSDHAFVYRRQAEAIYPDNLIRTIRKVRSVHFKESWTQIDPERADKHGLKEEHRLRLIRQRGG